MQIVRRQVKWFRDLPSLVVKKYQKKPQMPKKFSFLVQVKNE